MRKTAVAALGLVSLLALPASAANGTGPFTGSVAQGETDTHVYDNNPSNNPCLALAVTYTVTLAYAPTSDTLTLSVPGKTVTGSGGTATANVTRGICTEFSIGVTGTSVASSATYVVSVTRQVLPAVGGGSIG
jgi:hypothetical protein